VSSFSETVVPLLVHGILGPVLLMQARHVRRTALRLPEASGPRMGLVGQHHAPAPLLRLLVLGDSSAAGVGVALQSQALAMPTAQQLSDRIMRPVGWQLLARTGASTCDASEMLAGERICRADVALVALGVNDVTGRRSAVEFRQDTYRLIRTMTERCGVQAIVFTALPPMHLFPVIPQPLRWVVGEAARRLDAQLRDLCAREPGCHHLGLEWAEMTVADAIAEDGYHPGPTHYAQWAGHSAARLAGILQDHVAGFLGDHHGGRIGVS
jgi:lysophospholipase L1-like esterase